MPCWKAPCGQPRQVSTQRSSGFQNQLTIGLGIDFGIELLENENLIRLLPVKVIPFVVRVICEENIGGHIIAPHDICLDQAIFLYSTAVAYGEWPVLYRTRNGSPNTVKVSQQVIDVCSGTGVLTLRLLCVLLGSARSRREHVVELC